jgi:hypothetical protein
MSMNEKEKAKIEVKARYSAQLPEILKSHLLKIMELLLLFRYLFPELGSW